MLHGKRKKDKRKKENGIGIGIGIVNENVKFKQNKQWNLCVWQVVEQRAYAFDVSLGRKEEKKRKKNKWKTVTATWCT